MITRPEVRVPPPRPRTSGQAYQRSGRDDVVPVHLDLGLGQRTRGRPGRGLTGLDGELAAVARAADAAAVYLVDFAAGVRADLGEGLELARRGLGDHVVAGDD